MRAPVGRMRGVKGDRDHGVVAEPERRSRRPAAAATRRARPAEQERILELAADKVLRGRESVLLEALWEEAAPPG